MTKKNFIALAEALRMSRPYSDDDYAHRLSMGQWRVDREAIIQVCYDANPRFQRAKFEEWSER